MFDYTNNNSNAPPKPKWAPSKEKEDDDKCIDSFASLLLLFCSFFASFVNLRKTWELLSKYQQTQEYTREHTDTKLNTYLMIKSLFSTVCTEYATLFAFKRYLRSHTVHGKRWKWNNNFYCISLRKVWRGLLRYFVASSLLLTRLTTTTLP